MTIPRSATTTTLESPKRSFSLLICDGQGRVVVQLAGEHLDRDRPPILVAQQAVDDLRQPELPITRVPQPPQRTRPALEVTARTRHRAPSPRRRDDGRRGDPRSASWRSSSQSIAAYRSSSSAPSTPSSLASVDCPSVRTVPSFDPGQITRPTIIARHRSRCRDAERSSSLARSSRRAIASAAFTCPAGSDRSISNASSRGHERLAGQHPADRVDRLRREMRQVRERLLLDLPVLTVGTPQQRRRVLRSPRPTRCRAHMHRATMPRRPAHAALYTHPPDICSGYT